MRPNWFVGLPVEAGSWLARVTSPPEGVRIFHADDLHLTVSFLGTVSEDQARAAFAEARALPLAPTTVRLGPVVPMGNRRRPSALSARLLDGEREVAEAITHVRDAVADAAGAARESRPALPHLTIARPRRTATHDERAEAVRWAATLDLGAPSVLLHEVALYTWASERKERLFTIVDRHALTAAKAPSAT